MASKNDVAPVTKTEISDTLASINVLSKLQPVTNDDELQERVDWYFEFCVHNGIRPGYESLALACGCNRRTLWNWETKKVLTDTRRSEIIGEAKQKLATFHESMMLSGRINPVSGIFIAKNNYGYTDKTEIEIAPKNPLGDTLSPEDIAKQIPQDIAINAEYEEE